MTTSVPEGETTASPDAILAAITDEHRRAVLRSLNRAEGKCVGLNRLTDEVAEHVRDGEPPDDERRRRVRIALHHNHLPKLERYGLIAYDAESDEVRNVADELSQKLLAVVEAYEAGA